MIAIEYYNYCFKFSYHVLDSQNLNCNLFSDLIVDSH